MGGNNLGVWNRHVHTVRFKMDNQEGSSWMAHETLLNAKWKSGWESSLGENGYMYIYGWVPSLFTWNYHNIVC